MDKVEKHVRFVTNSIKKIKAENMKEGKFTCICGKWVNFSVAPNGHSRGQCENPKCVSWIE